MLVKKQQLEQDTKQWTGSNWERHSIRLYSFTLFYLTNMQECIGENDGLDESQAGIKIAGKHINNLKYADDTTLMAE